MTSAVPNKEGFWADLQVPEEAPYPNGITHVDDVYPPGADKDPVMGLGPGRGYQFKESTPPKETKTVTMAEFRRMHEYSLSMPTMPSVGRYWRRWQCGLGWLYAKVVPSEREGYQRTVWSKLRVVGDKAIPVRRRGIKIRHQGALLDVEYSGDVVLILEGKHAGREAVLMGPDGDGWRVLLDGRQEVHVDADGLETLES